MPPRPHMSAKRRMEIWERCKGVCHICGHKIDGGRERWEVEHIIPWEMTRDDSDGNLAPAHIGCHADKTKTDVKHIAKGKRMQQRKAGVPRQSRNPLPGSRGSKWKKRIDGKVVLR